MMIDVIKNGLNGERSDHECLRWARDYFSEYLKTENEELLVRCWSVVEHLAPRLPEEKDNFMAWGKKTLAIKKDEDAKNSARIGLTILHTTINEDGDFVVVLTDDTKFKIGKQKAIQIIGRLAEYINK